MRTYVRRARSAIHEHPEIADVQLRDNPGNGRQTPADRFNDCRITSSESIAYVRPCRDHGRNNLGHVSGECHGAGLLHEIGLTINIKETRVRPVTRPPNQITSPYACNGVNDALATAISAYTHYEDNGQVLEDRVHGYAEVLLFAVIDPV